MVRTAVSLAVSRRNRPSEILLVERSRKLRFFGGFHAFPGGAVDDEDRNVPVRRVSDPALAPVLAAGARELFEETGLWIARGGKAPEENELREDRRRLLAGDVAFPAILERHRQHLDARDLDPLCRMTTPAFQVVRFDTQFLRVLVGDDAKLEIWDGELVSGEFIAPGDALDRWRRGEIAIAPPMVILLGEWGASGDVDRIRRIASSYDAGKLHRIYFSPGILRPFNFIFKERIQKKVMNIRIVIICFLDSCKKYRSYDTSASPHQCYPPIIQIPLIFFGCISHQNIPLGI